MINNTDPTAVKVKAIQRCTLRITEQDLAVAVAEALGGSSLVSAVVARAKARASLEVEFGE